MESISPSELIKLRQECKPCVWGLRAYKGNKLFGEFTGFCVKSDGLIMSCAHIIHDVPDLVFRAWRLDDDGLVYIAKRVLKKPNWDITLYQIDEIKDAKVVKFGTGLVDVGETVLLIGHPRFFVGSFLVGHCAFECVSDVSLPTDDMRCSEYHSTILTKTPAYRVIGHYLNRSLIENCENRGTPLPQDASELHPLLPVIQSKGLRAASGASGAPLFNAQGELIGMYIISSLGYDISVHVSLLKEYLRIESLNSDDPGGKSQRSEVVGEHIEGSTFEMGFALNKRQKN